MKEKLAWALLILIFIGLENHAAAAASKSTTFYPTQISDTSLTEANKTEVFVSVNEQACAMQANSRPWCQLVCYQDHQCSLYDLLLGAYHEDNSQDALEFCWTNVEGCVMEGNIYQEGEMLSETCSVPLVCRNRRWQPIAEGSTIWAVDVPTVGKLSIHNELKNFHDASACCNALLGQLTVVADPGAFPALKYYLASTGINNRRHWIGVRAGKWLDGRDVIPSDWQSGGPLQPATAQYCAYLHPFNSGLIDLLCTDLYAFICQKN